MNTKPLIVTCVVENEEKQIVLTPEFPGSNIYHIFIDRENQGIIRKVTKEWFVDLNEDSKLTKLNCDTFLRAVTSAEYLNN